MIKIDPAAQAPRVTIGVPVYNAQRYLEPTLESLLDQDYPDFELLISDNGSTDRTEEICRRFAERDSRIRYYRNDENLGAAENYNRLVALARGELFKWAAYDDMCAPSYVSSCVAALDRHPDAVLAYPKTTIIDGDGGVVDDFEDGLDLPEAQPWRRLASFTRRWNLCNACFGLMRTAVLRQSVLIQPFVSSDVVFLADMTLRGRFVEIDERLFFRRVHKASSRQGQIPVAQIHAWFSPGRRAPRITSPRVVVFLNTIRVVLRSDLGGVARVRCLVAYVTTWTTRRLRVHLGAAKQLVQARAQRPEPATQPGTRG